jgi:RNA polymerase sigma-70 factor (ECF subfamily)
MRGSPGTAWSSLTR